MANISNAQIQALITGVVNGFAPGGPAHVAPAAAAAPAVLAPPVAYGGSSSDFEKIESGVAKFVETNCVDVDATPLQNVTCFLAHCANVYKVHVATFDTRDDMERFEPSASNPNAFSERVDELAKAFCDSHGPAAASPWPSAGGDIRPAYIAHLADRIAPQGIFARRRHGTKSGPDNGHVLPGGAGAESCRGLFTALEKSAFWQAHEQFPQLPEYVDFAVSAGPNTAPQTDSASVGLSSDKCKTVLVDEVYERLSPVRALRMCDAPEKGSSGLKSKRHVLVWTCQLRLDLFELKFHRFNLVDTVGLRPLQCIRFDSAERLMLAKRHVSHALESIILQPRIVPFNCSFVCCV